MIFPIPKKEEYSKEFYSLKNRRLCELTLLDLYAEIKAENSECDKVKEDTFQKEEYQLLIRPDKISIIYSEEEGLFRAVTSLFQLIKKQGENLSCAYIYDCPNVKRRGYMLDISRKRMPTVETLKNLIDHLAELKYNEFQLYMESFCFKYKHFPEYTKDFECLTPHDIKELDLYCRERFIDLVPNQNSFGHMKAWLEEEELRGLGISDGEEITGTLNPLLPETIDFVDKLYDSLIPLFSSEYVNIGLDEADALGKFQTEEVCRKYGRAKVFAEYFEKLNKLVNEKYGKKAMFWSDMVNRNEGGYELVPKNTIALEWGYDLIQSQLMAENCIKFKEHGIPFYVCPACMTHCSFTGRTDVMTFNIRTAGEIAQKYGADGYLLTDWGETGHTSFWIWSLVPSALGAQYAWNSGEVQYGFKLKADYIKASWKYIDHKYFDGYGVSENLSLLGNYYLLERERIHNWTLSNKKYKMSLDTKVSPLMDYEDVYTNNSVINYVKHYWEIIESMPIDELFQKQISVNCRMVILSEELSNIRLGHNVTAENAEKLIDFAECLKKDFKEIWLVYNYEKGVEVFLSRVDERIQELREIVSM